jgi:hypothetical protein
VTKIDLTPQQFEVAFQVSHQAANFQEPSLAELGVSLDELDELLGLLASARERLPGAHGVRIRFGREAAGMKEGTVSAGAGDRSDTDDVTVVAVPPEWRHRWRRIMDLAASGLSSREMFLRTGFDSDEVFEMLQKF